MKPTEHRRDHTKHLAFALAAAAGLAAGSAQALTTTATFDLDNGGSGTTVGAQSVLSPVWIAAGSLPAGSILRSVSIDATLDTAGADNTYANDLFVYLDPGTPDSGGEVLQVGGYDALGTPTTVVAWDNGGSGAIGTTCIDTTSAPDDFPDTIDLNGVGVYIGSRGLVEATWSGEITVEYDVFVPAAIESFGPGAVVGELSGTAADIAWTVPYGTDVTALAPTFTLSSGTCDRDNGGPTTYDFTNPVAYTVTDGGTINVYTVTVSIASSVLWNVAGGGDWDQTTANWLTQPGATSTTFVNGNEATFSNTAGGTINVTAGIEPAFTTVNATSGTYTFNGEPIATGGLVKDDAGTLSILANNTYDGGTTINGGRLEWKFPGQTSGLGTGPVTLNDGTFYLWRVIAENSLTINGGSIDSWNGFGNIWNGPITLNTDLNCHIQYKMSCTNTISGVGGVNKGGPEKLTLSGTNSYTGPTSVTAGTLQCESADALGSGDLSINSGSAKVNLNFTGTKTITSLTLGGVLMTNPGSYGSLASDAIFKDDDYFEGTGTVSFGDMTTAAYILSFGTNVTGSAAIIDPVVGNAAAISWIVPNGTDFATLAPEFVLSAGATCTDQTSGAIPSPDFSAGPVPYTIQSPDTNTTNVYTVTATELPAEDTLIWNLAGGGDWDLTSINWRGESSGLSAPFINGVNAIFDNTAGGTIVIDTGTEPLTTTVNAASGTYVFDGVLATGSLTKDGGGRLDLGGLAPNTYSGGTIIGDGTLYLGRIVSGTSLDVIDPVGTGTVTLNNGTIYLGRVKVSNDLIVDGGTLYQQNGWGATWSGPITLNVTTNCGVFHKLTISADISGTGGLTKTHNGTLILSGTNSYTGPTSVTAGTLQCNSPDALTGGDLSISAGGAKVNLNYSGTKSIASLTLDGVAQTVDGTYGSATSGATFQSAYFDGTGTVTIGGTDFASWIGSFPVTDTSFNGDDDGDDLGNGIEGFFGTDPSVGNGGLTEVSRSTNTVTFTHPNPDTENVLTDVTGSYQWSLDLDTWYDDDGADGPGDTTVTTVATPDSPATNTTTVVATIGGTVPAKIFLRAVATQTM